MKLTEKEQDIIFCAELQADLPVSELRKLSGHRDHTIRYCLQRNLERGLIQPHCFINLCLLGFTQYEIFFSLSPEGERCRPALLNELVAAPQISWIGELGGDYQFGFNFCASSANEITDFLNSLSQSFGEIFAEKDVAVRVALSYFGNRYLSKKDRPVTVLQYGATHQRTQIDELDHRILCGLMKHSGISHRSLARLIATPLSTVEFRIKRLEQAGIIVAHYFVVDPAQIGMQSFLLLIGVRGVDNELHRKFSEFCKTQPNVTVLIQTVGSWDFEIALEVPDARLITQFTQALNDAFGATVRFVKVLPSFRYPKVKEYPFESLPRLANS